MSSSNSLLMRLSTTIFGTSHLAVRAPAFGGALAYILAAYLLCRAIGRQGMVQCVVFACLVLNPFVLDVTCAAFAATAWRWDFGCA